jgi:hypothetical protein
MALTHNDDSVLERHHCRVTFIILGNQAANILENIPRESFFKIRKLIIHCILSTDMSKHFEKCKILEGLTKKQLHEKKYTLISIILHAADLSAQTLPYDQAVRWGMRVLNEFQNQAKSEQELKLPVDSFMTNLHQMKTRFTVQINFINFVLRPIWIPLASLCQNLRIYADTLESNFEHYKEDLEKVNTNSESNDNVNTTAPVGSGARHTLTRGDTMRTSITGNSHLDVINIVRKKLVDRKQRLSAGNLATK